MKRLFLSILLGCGLACASAPPGSGDSGPGGSDDPPAAPSSTCSGALEPVAISQPSATVGSGTTDTCTAAALSAAVAAGGNIVFNCGNANHTIILSSTLSVTADTVIDGGGLITLSGNDSVRIFNMVGSPSLTLQRITLENGRASTHGAAVFANTGGEFTAIDATFRDNHATTAGRDIGGGALYMRGAVVAISGSVFSGNSGANGGAIGNLRSNLSIVNTVFFSNEASGTGGIAGQGGYGGGVYIDGMHQTIAPRELTVCGTAFEANESHTDGGGLYIYLYPGEEALVSQSAFTENRIDAGDGNGGAIYHQRELLTLQNSTLAGNFAASVGGGIFVGPDSEANITNVTFTANEADGLGGAIFSWDSPTNVTHATIANNHGFFSGGISGGTNVTLTNTIIANNTHEEPYNGLNCQAAMTDGGGNVQYPEFRPNGTRDDLCVANPLIANPLLGALADNGGPTQTLLPAANSPALAIGQNCASIDQRGNSRAAPCDSGAVER